MGHASLTLGNAFIVFGGDTKIEETDELDDNLYLLNTTSLKWTVAAPSGRRPSGRYGHTISTIGSVLYVFGGQLDDFFFDDLISYDLTTLQSPDSHWNFIKPNSSSPPPRTNHTIITYQDKLYLFGGTDGKLWYSDTWVFDPTDNTWTALECAGFIPAPCEGHSATIVGDIMYVFGGRSAEGKDLGTLSALKIPARKWFSFQNMGPGPTPRSGHSMTAFGGHKILIMGGESPDLDVQNPDGFANDYESNNLVFVLDTSRISYPPTANETPIEKRVEEPRQITGPPPPIQASQAPVSVAGIPPPEKRSISMEANSLSPSAPQKVQQIPSKADRSESIVSELTPGYGYERVEVGDKEDHSSNSEDEAHTPKTEPRDYRDAQSDKTNTPASTIHPESPPKHKEADDFIKSESLDTLQPGPVQNLNQALEQLKASNSWYETELAAARDKGFIPSTRPPVNVLQLRRVSQRITQDTDGSLSERAILVEALSDLKEELQELQENVKNQAEQASAKIAEAEADRDDAFERMKLLEAQLMAAQGGNPSGPDGLRSIEKAQPNESAEHLATIASLTAQLNAQRNMRVLLAGDVDGTATELEKVKADNINLEQQLRTLSDRSILAEHEASRYKSQFELLEDKHRVLESTTDDHIKALSAAAVVVAASQAKSDDFTKLIGNRDAEKAMLQERVSTLTAELEGTRMELADANMQLEENRSVLLSRTTEKDAVASTALTTGVESIAAMWAASKVFGAFKKKKVNRELNEADEGADPAEKDEEDDDTELASIRKQLGDVTSLYETHQKASTNVTRQLSDTLNEMTYLKQELVSGETSRARVTKQLEKAEAELNQLKEKLDHALQQKSDESEGQVEELKKQLEEYEDRYESLEKEYENSLQYVHNSDKALTKTREELTKHKDNSSKLQAEIDQLRLRLQDPEDDEDNESVGSSNAGMRSRNDHRVGTPPAKYNSRQIDLQLKDLRAQIIILQEEREELRASTLEVKKKLITHAEDLKDSHAMIEQLEKENDALVKRVRAAEDPKGSTSGSGSLAHNRSHSYLESPVDPEHADRTLDDFTSELDEIRNQRERISGILNTSN